MGGAEPRRGEGADPPLLLGAHGHVVRAEQVAGEARHHVEHLVGVEGAVGGEPQDVQSLALLGDLAQGVALGLQLAGAQLRGGEPAEGAR